MLLVLDDKGFRNLALSEDSMFESTPSAGNCHILNAAECGGVVIDWVGTGEEVLSTKTSKKKTKKMGKKGKEEWEEGGKHDEEEKEDEWG